jgi:hypothetical protein
MTIMLNSGRPNILLLQQLPDLGEAGGCQTMRPEDGVT